MARPDENDVFSALRSDLCAMHYEYSAPKLRGKTVGRFGHAENDTL